MKEDQVRCLDIRNVESLVKVLNALQALTRNPFLETDESNSASSIQVSVFGNLMQLKHANAIFTVPIEWVESDWAEEVLQEPCHSPPACILTIPSKALQPLQQFVRNQRTTDKEDECAHEQDLNTVQIKSWREDLNEASPWRVEFSLESSRPPIFKVALCLGPLRAVRSFQSGCREAHMRINARALYQTFLQPLNSVDSETGSGSGTGCVNMNIVPEEMLICWMQWGNFGLGPILSFAFIPGRLCE